MLSWLSLLLSEAPGEPSIRRVALAVAVLMAAAVCAVGLWRPVDEGTRTFVLAITASAFAAVTAGRFAEALDGRKGGGA